MISACYHIDILWSHLVVKAQPSLQTPGSGFLSGIVEVILATVFVVVPGGQQPSVVLILVLLVIVQLDHMSGHIAGHLVFTL